MVWNANDGVASIELKKNVLASSSFYTLILAKNGNAGDRLDGGGAALFPMPKHRGFRHGSVATGEILCSIPDKGDLWTPDAFEGIASVCVLALSTLSLCYSTLYVTISHSKDVFPHDSKSPVWLQQ